MPGSVKAIIPEKFDEKAMMAVLEAEFEKYAPYLLSEFKKTTAHWKGEKPVFKAVMTPHKGRNIRLEIRVLGPQKGRDKWRWLNEGTKPHTIRPKGKGYPLRFQAGYQAGSKPGQTFTTSGRKSGEMVAAMEVHHPGTAAREWSELIEKMHQRPFERWMQAAMGHAAEASGHAIKK